MVLAVAAVIGAVCIAVRYKSRIDAENTYRELSENANAVSEGQQQETVEAVLPETETEETPQGLSPEGLLQASGEGDVSGNDEEDIPEAVSEAPGKSLDWDELHQTNPDIYAWIYVPGTSIDYPVLQHPSSNEYYLNHNLDGSYGFPGVIYTENYNSKDFTDPNTVLYGHNMDNTTMFSTLHNFRNPDMVSEPHYIYIYTEDGRTLVYEIYAAYIYPSIHLLLNFDIDNDYIFEQYLRNISNMDITSTDLANIRHDIDVTVDDRIITLSTCTTDHDASKRFLVTGVLLNP
ncbi:MAG: class B sortase [Lachnospiraceae bacterium]|nr:class B sortase [Lachnospiraceae bacterium]